MCQILLSALVLAVLVAASCGSARKEGVPFTRITLDDRSEVSLGQPFDEVAGRLGCGAKQTICSYPTDGNASADAMVFVIEDRVSAIILVDEGNARNVERLPRVKPGMTLGEIKNALPESREIDFKISRALYLESKSAVNYFILSQCSNDNTTFAIGLAIRGAGERKVRDFVDTSCPPVFDDLIAPRVG